MPIDQSFLKSQIDGLQSRIKTFNNINSALSEKQFFTAQTMNFLRRALVVGIPQAREEQYRPDDPSTPFDESWNDQKLLDKGLKPFLGFDSYEELSAEGIDLSEVQDDAKDKIKQLIAQKQQVQNDIKGLEGQIRDISLLMKKDVDV